MNKAKELLGSIGTGPLQKQGEGDGYVVRLDADGNVKWASLIGGPGSDSWGCIQATSAGTVLLAGRFQGSFTFLGSTVVGSPDAGTGWDIGVLTLQP